MARRKQPAISDEPPEQRRRMRVDLLTAISESLLLLLRRHEIAPL